MTGHVAAGMAGWIVSAANRFRQQDVRFTVMVRSGIIGMAIRAGIRIFTHMNAVAFSGYPVRWIIRISVLISMTAITNESYIRCPGWRGCAGMAANAAACLVRSIVASAKSGGHYHIFLSIEM